MTDHVWVVREEIDKTEGRGGQRDVAVCASEEEAMEVNKDVCGVQGVPRNYGGDVYKITLGTYPVQTERVWGYRQNGEHRWGHGWVDNRDDPKSDPEWGEFQRLSKKFEAIKASTVNDPYAYKRQS